MAHSCPDCQRGDPDYRVTTVVSYTPTRQGNSGLYLAHSCPDCQKGDPDYRVTTVVSYTPTRQRNSGLYLAHTCPDCQRGDPDYRVTTVVSYTPTRQGPLSPVTVRTGPQATRSWAVRRRSTVPNTPVRVLLLCVGIVLPMARPCDIRLELSSRYAMCPHY